MSCCQPGIFELQNLSEHQQIVTMLASTIHVNRGKPLTQDIELTDHRISDAVAQFFHRGAGPSHQKISNVLVRVGLDDGYKYDPNGSGPTKSARILNALSRARRKPGSAHVLLEGILGILANDELLTPESQDSEEFQKFKRALAGNQFYVDGHLKIHRFAQVDFQTGGRPALEQQLRRMNKATGDTALLLGTSKEVLESTAKLVLEQVRGYERETLNKMKFPQLWALSRECLGIMPKQVDVNQPNYEAVRTMYQGVWQIVEQVNTLRNSQGTGHGDTLPLGISEPLAKFIVKEVCVVAELMLEAADRLVGRPNVN